MASFSNKGSYFEWVGDEGSIYTLGNKYASLNNSLFSSSLRNSIPAYTKLDKVEVGLRWKTSVGSSKGDGYLYIGDNQIGGEWNTGKTYRDDWSGNVVGYFQSGTANVGIPSSEIRARFEASWGRTSYYTFKIRWYPIWTVTVNGGSGGGEHKMGSTITITADNPPAGHKFVKWNDDANAPATRTVTVTGNATYTAIFEKLKYTLTVTAGANGSVTGGGTYEYGSTATLTATPNVGYKFVKWNDDANAPATRTVTVTGNATYTATFEPITYHIYYKDVDGTIYGPWSVTYDLDHVIALGNIMADPPNFDIIIERGLYGDRWSEVADKVLLGWKDIDTGVVYGVYDTASKLRSEDGATVTFTPIWSSYGEITLKPESFDGYEFLGWSDGSNFYQPDETVRVTSDTTFTGQWKAIIYTITCIASPENGGSINGGGDHEYDSIVTLTATPNSGYEFVRWTDGVTTATRTVTVTGAATYTAVFRLNKIYIGTSRAKAIYIGTTPVKAIYVGTTKVYEQ